MLRRQALLGFCCTCAAGLPSFAATGTPVSSVEIATGVHIRRGLDQDATSGNDDAIANIGFVIGGDSVAVIDPGGSLADGLALRARIAALTDKPVRYVILSHVHPDHVFGAAAFRQDGVSFVGHAQLPNALRARGEFYRQGLETLLGARQAGEVVMPDKLVAEQDRVDLGGRVLLLRAHRVAHTNCDLSVLDISTSTWLSGDLLFVGRVPSLDGSLDGWIAELESLQSQAVARVVPGHGPVSVEWPAASTDLLRYLRILRHDVRALIARGAGIEQAPHAAVEERSRWTLFDDYNGRNATEAFRELEWE